MAAAGADRLVVLTVWTTAVIVQWLAGLGIRPGGTVDVELIAAAEPGVAMPEMPDRVAIVVPAPGAGLAMEGVLDRPEFDLMIRGPQGRPLEAQAMAQAADRLILAASVPAELGPGTWVTAVDRVGGRPAPVDRGMDGDRATYQATYVTTLNDA